MRLLEVFLIFLACVYIFNNLWTYF